MIPWSLAGGPGQEGSGGIRAVARFPAFQPRPQGGALAAPLSSQRLWGLGGGEPQAAGRGAAHAEGATRPPLLWRGFRILGGCFRRSADQVYKKQYTVIARAGASVGPRRGPNFREGAESGTERREKT